MTSPYWPIANESPIHEMNCLGFSNFLDDIGYLL